jgi:hypothetical protein
MTENKIQIAEFAHIIKEFGRKHRLMFEENLTFPNKSMHTIKENVGSSNVKLRFFFYLSLLSKEEGIYEILEIWTRHECCFML